MAKKKAASQKKPSKPSSALSDPTEPLLSWQSSLTSRKIRDREFFTTAAAIAFLIVVILFFLKEWFLIIFIMAFGFYFYVMSTTPAQMVEHEVTEAGIATAGKKYSWDKLSSFWFTEMYGRKQVHVSRLVGFPQQLVILLGDQKEDRVRKVLVKYLIEEAPEPDFVEKSSRWLNKKIPLDK
ncbi:hypothetical protein MUP65_02375 [Patescibacteria group bacterium]|nr:hypothetical protein [Patescibacteria group bacterium]